MWDFKPSVLIRDQEDMAKRREATIEAILTYLDDFAYKLKHGDTDWDWYCEAQLFGSLAKHRWRMQFSPHPLCPVPG